MTDAVTRVAQTLPQAGNDLAIPVTRDAERDRRMRARRRLGLVVRRIELQREWLDALEQRGCLDPFERGNRAHEREAIETLLAMCVPNARVCGRDQ